MLLKCFLIENKQTNDYKRLLYFEIALTHFYLVQYCISHFISHEHIQPYLKIGTDSQYILVKVLESIIFPSFVGYEL